MKPKFQLLLVFCIIAVTTRAQQDQPTLFNYGDPPPLLRVREWIKGTPVQSFEKGNVYVVEFWATWCKPCIAAMPHLSDLAREYKDTVTVLAIDVYEKKTTSTERVKAFVGGIGDRMDFHVAAEDTNFTVHDWLDAWGEKDYGIPRTFVVNAQGRVAWIGHPKDLDTVLRKIVNNTWDIKEALSKRSFNTYLKELDLEVFSKVHRYAGDYNKLDDLGKPDSALLVINEMVKKEPRLKYAPVIASFTFSALLRTNTHKAYEFGKGVMVTPTYEEPAYDFIIGDIEGDSRKLKIPAEIYRLGAECYQAEIDHAPYSELVDIPGQYRKMAAWYRLAGDKSKAMEAQQKVIKLERAKNH
ncbi:MAG TPA: TlpA disulfide reductase family protein [Mucilaginibacter sp.]